MLDLIIFAGMLLGLVELTKITLNINKRYIPIITLLIAGIISFIYIVLTKNAITWELVTNILVTTLTAMGLWSGSKAIIGK